MTISKNISKNFHATKNIYLNVTGLGHMISFVHRHIAMEVPLEEQQ